MNLMFGWKLKEFLQPGIWMRAADPESGNPERDTRVQSLLNSIFTASGATLSSQNDLCPPACVLCAAHLQVACRGRCSAIKRSSALNDAIEPPFISLTPTHARPLSLVLVVTRRQGETRLWVAGSTPCGCARLRKRHECGGCVWRRLFRPDDAHLLCSSSASPLPLRGLSSALVWVDRQGRVPGGEPALIWC